VTWAEYNEIYVTLVYDNHRTTLPLGARLDVTLVLRQVAVSSLGTVTELQLGDDSSLDNVATELRLGGDSSLNKVTTELRFGGDSSLEAAKTDMTLEQLD